MTTPSTSTPSTTPTPRAWHAWRGHPVARAWERQRGNSRPPAIAAALLIAAASALLLFSGRGNWFILDELSFATDRGDLTTGTIFGPQNQNCVATLVLIYRAMFELFGFNDYLPWRLLLTALVAGIGVLAYLYARKRIGPWWALLPLALITVTPGFEIALWPFQMGQALSVLCGLAVLVLLDRDSNWPIRAAIAVLLLVAVASSSAGIPLVAIFVYDRLLRPGGRRDLLAVLPSAAFYSWWYLEWASREPAANQAKAGAIAAAIDRAYSIANGAMVNLLGLGGRASVGLLLAQLAVGLLSVLVAWRVFGPYRAGRGRVIALVAGLATYWVLLAWGRPFVPGLEITSRYVFLSQVLLVLLIVEVAVPASAAIADAQARGRRLVVPLAAAGGVAIVLVTGSALLYNSKSERSFGAMQRAAALDIRGQAFGLALLEPANRQNATMFLAPGGAVPRPAAGYFAALERYGEQPATERDVLALPAPGRSRADQALLGFYAPGTPATPPLPERSPAPMILSAAPKATKLRRRAACLGFRGPGATPATVELPGSPQGVVVKNTSARPLTLTGRRYAPDWKGPARFGIPPRTSVPVRLPPDRGTRPWRVQVVGQAGEICSLKQP